MKRALVYRTSARGRSQCILGNARYRYRTDTSTDMLICIGCLLYPYSSTPIQPTHVRIGQAFVSYVNKNSPSWSNFFWDRSITVLKNSLQRGWQFRVPNIKECIVFQTDTNRYKKRYVPNHSRNRCPAHFDP